MKHINTWLFLVAFPITAFSQLNSIAEQPSFETDTSEEETVHRQMERMIQDREFPGTNNGAFGRYAEEMNDYRSHSPQTLTANWTYVNSAGNSDVGRTCAVTFDTSTTGKFYVSTDHSGVWLTSNDGASYSPITESLPTQSIAQLVINPSNTNVLYIATGSHNQDMPPNSLGVYKSTDGGGNWNATGLTFFASQQVTIGDLVINPQNHNSLLAATTSGIFRTYDGGTNWTQILTDTSYSVRFKPGDTTVIYSVGKRYYRSVNSGGSFTQISAGIHSGYYYYKEFSLRTTNASPNIVYLLTTGLNASFVQKVYIHKSTDSGLTFTVTDSIAVGGFDVFDASMQNTDKLICGYYNTYKKENTSSSFQTMTTFYPSSGPYAHSDQRGVFFHPQNDNIIYLCNDGGLYRSTDNGLSFQNITANMQLAHLYDFGNSQDTAYKILTAPLDVSPYIIGSNGIERTFSNWNESFMSHMNPLNDSVYCLDGHYNYSENFLTEDDGATFFQSSSPLIQNTVYHPHNFQYSECNEGICYYGSWNDLYKSMNYGHDFSLVGSTHYNPVNSFITEMQGIIFCRANPDFIYVYYPDSVYRSSDGGVSFANITAGLPVSLARISHMIVDPVNENHIWISFSGYSSGNKVFYSSDAGQTWTNISTGMPNVPVNELAYQNGVNDGLYAGTDGGVFYKDNNFSSWQLFNTGMPNVMVTSLEIQYSSGKLRAATFGRGVWESDLYQPTPPGYVLPPAAIFTAQPSTICAGGQVTFNSLSCGLVTTYAWSFPGGTPSSSSSPAPVVSYAATGSYPVTLTVSNAFGSSTRTYTNYINVLAPASLPFYEPVATTNLPYLPSGFSTTDVNLDGISWEREYNWPGSLWGTDECIRYDNFNIDLGGQEEGLVLPPLDLSSATHPLLVFYRSYAQSSAATNDTLLVKVKNCGGTESLLYKKGGAQLQTYGTYFGSNPWFPQTQATWVRDTVDLLAFAGQGNVIITFYDKGYHGQVLYLDNFQVEEQNSLPPVSCFTYNLLTQPCVYSTIDLFDCSNYYPTTWDWQFPGGSPSSSTAQNPMQISYFGAGTYTITLTASNSNGTGTTYTQTITVLPAPANPTITQAGNMLTCTTPGTAYQWYFSTTLTSFWLPSNQIPGATSSTLTMTQNGYYGIALTDSNGCVSYFNQYYMITGISAQSLDGTISVFPNPASEQVFIKNETGQTALVSVTDISGREVMNFVAAPGDSQKNILSLSPGIYFFHVNDTIIRVMKQ